MKKYSQQIDKRYNQHYSVNRKPYFVVTCISLVTVIVLLILAIAVTRDDYKKKRSTTLFDDRASSVAIYDGEVKPNESQGVGNPSSDVGTSSQPETIEVVDGYSVLNFTGQVDDWRLKLANRVNIIKDYTPTTTYIGKEYCMYSDNYQIDERVYDDLIAMIKAAESDGVYLRYVSAYRPYSSQERLYKNKVQQYLNQGYSQKAAEDKASTIVAIPGTSDHSLGLAVDFNYLEQKYENEKELVWLKNNAEKYGFVMRYAKDKEKYTGVIYEPWHYRYVGKEHAEIMNEKNMCLEEYVKYLSKNS